MTVNIMLVNKVRSVLARIYHLSKEQYTYLSTGI